MTDFRFSARTLARLTRGLLSLLVCALVLSACDDGPPPGPTATVVPPTATAPPPGVRVVFGRQGGFARYCDEVLISADGTTQYRDTCKGIQARGQLSETDRAYLAELATRVGRFVYAPATPESRESVALTLAFFGDGSATQPDAGDQAHLIELAQQANDALRATQAGATAAPAGELEEVALALSTARGDRDLLRAAIRDFLNLPEIRAQSDADAAVILQGMMIDARVYPAYAPAVEVRRLDPEHRFAIVNHPAPALTLYGPTGWHPLSEGTHVVDLRTNEAGDQIAAIVAYEGEHTSTELILLGHAAEDWTVAWSSAGRADWQSLDGGAIFAQDGLERVQVAGLSLSPMAGEGDVPIYECPAFCPRRYFSATWTLDTVQNAYVRPDAVASSGDLGPMFWSFTVRDEYATVYEFMRRLRAGDTVGARALVAEDAVLTAATQARLGERRFVYQEQTYDMVFSAARADLGVIKLQPFGVRTLPDGKKTQVQLEGAVTVILVQTEAGWVIQQVGP